SGDSCFYKIDDARHGGFGIVRRHEVEVTVCVGRAEIRNRALIDAMGTDDDAALRSLPEHFCKAHYRDGAGCDDVGQDLSWPDGRKRVDVATDQHSAPFRHRPHESRHKHDIDNGGFVDNQRVTVERVVVAALETAALWVDLQQTVDGLG